MADETAQKDPSLPPGWTVVDANTPGPPTAPELPTGFLERLHDALGAGIRGAGDVTGANWLLESTGLVPEGRLSGPERNARDEQTRHTTSFGGGAMMAAEAVPALAKLLKPSNLADALELALHPKSAGDKAVAWLRGTAATTPAAARLVGKAPTLEESLIQALNDVRDGQPPMSVSLPGGGTSRAAAAVGEAVPGPARLGAWSSEALPETAARSGGVRLRAPEGRVSPTLVQSPQDIAAADQLKRALRPSASLEGMKSAARVSPRSVH